MWYVLAVFCPPLVFLFHGEILRFLLNVCLCSLWLLAVIHAWSWYAEYNRKRQLREEISEVTRVIRQELQKDNS